MGFLKKKKYKDLCYKYGMENDCFQNQHFNITTDEVPHYSKPTRELNTTCADGYCPCNVAKPSAMPTGTPSSGNPTASRTTDVPTGTLAPAGSPTASSSWSPTGTPAPMGSPFTWSPTGSFSPTASRTTDVPTGTLAPAGISTFNSKEELKLAIDLWLTNEKSQHGEIEDWDVSRITDMSALFRSDGYWDDSRNKCLT